MRMKIQVGILIFLALIFFGAMAGTMIAVEPIAEAQAEIMLRHPDPYEQIMESRRADTGGSAVGWILVVLVFVILGIAFYALSERYTKAIRATKAMFKPARRAARVPTLQQVQPVQPVQITAGGETGNEQWENPPMQQSPQ